jgi:transcriptional antiterminator NusG
MGVLFRSKSSQVEDVKVASDPESRDEITPEQSSDSPGAAEAVPGDAPHGEHDASFTDDTEVDALEDEEEEVVEEGEPAADESADTVDAATPAEAEEAVAEQEGEPEEELVQRWYILKVQVNREESIRRALERRIKIAGLERFFGEIVVPTEDVAEYNKSGKRRIVKKKLYPGYLMIHLALNDDTWFLVRETPGIGDFTGSAGKPTPARVWKRVSRRSRRPSRLSRAIACE